MLKWSLDADRWLQPDDGVFALLDGVVDVG
jgi:hypothetical protein